MPTNRAEIRVREKRAREEAKPKAILSIEVAREGPGDDLIRS
jgi:hypothetical protein